MNDNNIDEILKQAENVEIYEFKHLYDFGNNQQQYNSYRRLVTIVMTTELKLLTLIASNKAILSEKGKRISENGGWLKYIEDEKLKADRSKRKDKWDYYYSKYRYFTYWWIFSFSVIAFILSIYNFIQTLQSPRNEVNKEATRTPIQQREGEAAKPHTSSSVPQTSDSLKTPNQENNSLQFEPQKDSLKQKSK